MNRLISTLASVMVGLVVITAATPALTRLAHALLPLVLVVGVVAAGLRVVWAAARRW